MCGRFSQGQSKDKINKRFKVDASKHIESYNIAPTQKASIILDSEPNKISLLKWGFPLNIQGTKKILNNARSETIYQKRTFSKSIKEKRCLIIADSFYEWRKKDKQPYRILLKNEEPFVMAGIWKESEGDLYFTVITTGPNEIMKPLHHRMPVILQPKYETEWLSDIAEDEIQDLMIPYKDNDLEAYPISTLVNKVANNSPEVHAQI